MQTPAKIVAVIQARTGSTRLPGKIMLPLAGAPLLYRMAERVLQSNLCNEVVIATTTDPDDDAVAELCKQYKLNCYRGHPTDLLDRHYQVALAYQADVVLKIPSDCPLIDPTIIDKGIRFFLDHWPNYDYVSNLHPATYPDGNDVEVMTYEALEKAWKQASRELEREHCTPYLWENPEQFRIGNFTWESGLDYSMSHRWTIDYPEDYTFIERIYAELYTLNPKFGIQHILVVASRTEIFNINSKYAGVNWYRNHLLELKTISPEQTKQL
ncbi:MAG TPA: glycosyltransferase family protein [Bacteroidia bacterium]|nr:glycosyltransferase family protein [Bacteroidia bacterium]